MHMCSTECANAQQSDIININKQHDCFLNVLQVESSLPFCFHTKDEI